MNVPNLPTDNLYKFCALVGTTVVLLSLYMPNSLVNDMEDKASSFRLEVRRAAIEVQYLLREVEQLEKEVEKLENGLVQLENSDKSIAGRKTDLRIHGSSGKAAKASLEGLNKKFLALRDAQKQHVLKEAEFSIAKEQIERLAGHTRFVIRTSSLTGLMGMLIAIYGFTNWYRKVQVHQDAIIRMQGEREERSRLSGGEAKEVTADEARLKEPIACSSEEGKSHT